MWLSFNLSALSLKQLVNGSCQAVGYHAGSASLGVVVSFLTQRFSDQSQRLTKALAKSNRHAWHALEVALAGEGLWDRCKRLLSSADEKAFREHLQPFLNGCPMAELEGREAYRARCLRELRLAAKSGILKETSFDPEQIAKKVGAFAQFNDPLKIIEAENELLGQMSQELSKAGHENLASLISIRPNQGDPVLVTAARYFFRRLVEEDAVLFRELAFAQLETLKCSQDQAFSSLQSILEGHLDKLEQIFDQLQQTHEVVLDLREEQQRQGAQADQIYQQVVDLQAKLDLVHSEIRPRDSLSIRNEQERRLVRDLVGRYRELPEQQREQLPALLNAIGKLEIAAGDFEAAQSDFATLAHLVDDSTAQSEAHFNAFHAALEQRHWDDALAELQKALDLDPRRFAPFPLDKLIPSRILGAGGFGVAYLCRHRYMKTDVVVKSLFDETLEPDVLFTEAQVLRQLNHPAIVRIQDCGFACPDEKRPYIVMDYFEGQTLEDQAREKALEVEELYQIAHLMIDGLQAAHDCRILHRDVKPANLIVQKQGEQWDARLIDFGLALDRSMHETLGATAHTLVGSSIAGTLDYASPEQMGKLPGVGVTAASDIYGFARTCCYALFQTPLPLPRHWRRIPEKLADVLEWCLEDHPDKRPQSFEEVKKRIQELSPTSQTVAVPIPTPKEEKSEAKPTEDANGRQELEMLAREVCQCTQCDQLAKTRTSTVFGAGPVPADICFIGEAPGADEDREGEPFIGQAGQLLDRIISAMGLKREDVYICNILKCRPPRNRTPLPTEAANCRGYLEKQLEIVKPKVIVALGGSAAQNLLGVTQTIGRLRRQVHRYKDTPVICTYHPAFLLPSRSPEKKRDVWDDMQLVLRQLEK